jgi:hypothetical protein
MALWKVSCLENRYPGMWQRWFGHQCVGIGWPPDHGWQLNGKSKTTEGWGKARKALQRVAVGDFVIVTLKNHRVGRLGVVTGKAIEDHEWDPLVPPRRDHESGEMGRRLLVRWDLTVGPDSRDMIVALPPGFQLTTAELRPTIAEVRSCTVAKLTKAMNDPQNWVGLLTHFDYERALSGYIAAYPHRLEDGLLPHPDERIRERVFGDDSRSDVLLMDRYDIPVVVECKQGAPSVEHLKQLRHYMQLLKRETRKDTRGILIHGGARKLSFEVATAAQKQPKIEVVQYALNVDFAACEKA